MPVYSKKQLRRILAQRYTRDMSAAAPNISNLGNLTGTPPITVRSGIIYGDVSGSGQNLYQNSWLYIEASTATPDTAPTMYQYLVATFNSGSGAFLSYQYAYDVHGTQSIFELHTRVAPFEKDNAIDETIKRMRIRQEVAIPTVDQQLFYTLDGCASPYVLDEVWDIHVFADPTGTTDRDERHVDDWQVVTTATVANELRLLHAFQGSQQIILDALLIPSLSGELATINIPDERWILAGAAARCYDFIIQQAPAQQVALLQQRRQEWGMEYSRLSARFQPERDKPIRLNDVVSGKGSQYPDNSTTGWW